MTEPPMMEWKLIHKCKTSLERQIWEALEIGAMKEEELLNCKSE